jgi:hypothetical protein
MRRCIYLISNYPEILNFTYSSIEENRNVEYKISHRTLILKNTYISEKNINIFKKKFEYFVIFQ